MLIHPIDIPNSVLVRVVLQFLPIVVFPDEFFEFREVAEERYAPTSVHEGGLEDPQIGAALPEEGLGTDMFAVKVPL